MPNYNSPFFFDPFFDSIMFGNIPSYNPAPCNYPNYRKCNVTPSRATSNSSYTVDDIDRAVRLLAALLNGNDSVKKKATPISNSVHPIDASQKIETPTLTGDASKYADKIAAYKNKAAGSTTATTAASTTSAVDETVSADSAEYAMLMKKVAALKDRAMNMIILANQCIEAGIDISAFKCGCIADESGTVCIGFNVKPADKITSVLTWGGEFPDDPYNVSISMTRGIRCIVSKKTDMSDATSKGIAMCKTYLDLFEKFETAFYAALDKLA